MAKVLVIGSGVSGLTTALLGLQQGHDVHMVYRDHWSDTVSAVAAAIWFPFAAEPQDKVNSWSRDTYEVFEDLASQTKKTGVFMTNFLVLVEDPEYVYWESALPPASVTPAEPDWILPGYATAYYVKVPLSDSSVYMPYLQETFIELGGTSEQRTVTNLKEECKKADWVINCSGLGAQALCNDQKMFPIQGQIIQLEKPLEPVKTLMDEHMPHRLAYILPRTNDVILGGTARPHESSTDVDPDATQKIIAQCVKRLPVLANAAVKNVRVGLRPGRSQVRLEKEEGLPIIHNYGHGGSGYTISWGCAREAIGLIK